MIDRGGPVGALGEASPGRAEAGGGGAARHE